ncbi:hypothetical protein [Bacillus horti]|uniref:Uncharacterized protein n=1 Tax=Caldalkalibacillus horti TaxID=77523 RepID=A0ABT9VW48_9BACI|nr:hypothetical protein [Bacillus horti]MDQ0165220.1 hypothetical protein [Bacillus horti]
MVHKKIKKFWDNNDGKKLSTFSFFMMVVSMTPFAILAFYFGYIDGSIYYDRLPWSVMYILLPVSMTIFTFFLVLTLTGLYAQVYKKKLSMHSILVGIIMVVIMYLINFLR